VSSTAEGGGHDGFSGEGERPWRAAGLPSYPGSDPGAYGSAYGRLAHSLSGFLDDLAEALPDQSLLEALTADLETWSGKLQPLAVPERNRVFGRRADLDGRGQTMSPTIVVTESDRDSVTGTVRFGPYFLGGNGAAHGGALPLMFDEVLGRLAQSGGRPASRTAYLHTDYRSITPIGRFLDVRAWVVSEEGRKRIVRATLHHADVLCAEAEGLFVALRPGQP
jgi:acyl-coenzyme A thioesterase PaaI-like protein